MRRIAVFSLTPAPPAPVATASTLKALAAAFPDDEIDVFYINQWLKDAPMAAGSAAAAALTSYAPDLLKGRKKLKYALFRTPWIFRWIKREAARRVDPERYAFSIQLQSLFDVSLPGLPNFVYTDHSHLENLNFDSFTEADLYSRAWIACERSVYHNATTTFTWSTNVSRSLVHDYGVDPARVACAHTGSNSAVPDEAAMDPDRYARSNVLFVGSDWNRKGGPVLLEAFGRLRDRFPGATLTIVGPPPDMPPPPGVAFEGSVPLARLPAYYGAAAIFCMPTRLEPFGNVFVEAMWQKLPIVATRVGALPDLVVDGETGFLVKTDDVEALTDRLATLLGDPARCARMGEAARRRAEGRYDWDVVAAFMRDRIEAALAPGASAPGERASV